MQISTLVRAVTTEDGKAVLEVDGEPFFEMNSVAAVIWAELVEGASPQQIIGRLKKRFGVPEERVAKDVNNLVGILKENHLIKDNIRTSDFHANLIWNKGIAARCEWRIPDEFPTGLGFSTVLDPVGHIAPPHLLDNLISNPGIFTEVKDGDLVWVRLSWIKSFLHQALPLIKAKFILVTADSDVAVPTPIMAEALQILEYHNVLHWFAQNCEGPGFLRRMSPIPIGIDFHTLSERPLWGEDMASPQEQERMLQSIRGEFRPAQDRTRKVYIDFAWQAAHLYRPAKRQQIIAKLLTNECVVFQTKALPRRQLWRKWGEYAFVISPHGIGLDCHRTWEALACGSIVLVPSSPLDSLYEGLPVIPVKDWNHITPRNLDNWLEHYSGCKVGEEKLTSVYWVNKMKDMAKSKMSSFGSDERTHSTLRLQPRTNSIIDTDSNHWCGAVGRNDYS